MTAPSPENNPAHFIRANVFGCESQEAFANIMRTTQATVSRWETWGRIPGHRQQDVRDLAKTLNLEWDDRWFFSVPERVSRDSARASA